MGLIISDLGTNKADFMINGNVMNEIEKCKERFIRNNEDPRISPYVTKEVAESWIESKRHGIDPNINIIGSNIKPKELSALLKDKDKLVKIAASHILKYSTFINKSYCCFALSDEVGTILKIIPGKLDNSFLNRLNARVGARWTEETSGTNGTALCVKHKAAVQLIGPEHYCTELRKGLDTSTVIKDDEGKIIGTLVLVHIIDRNLMDNIDRMHPFLLGWVTSIGTVIEKELSLLKKTFYFDWTKRILQFTSTNEPPNGFILIDNKGCINYLDKRSSEILKVSKDLAIGNNYKDLMGDQPAISKALNEGKTVLDSRCEIADMEGKINYRLNVEPIVSKGIMEPQGAVIHIFPSKTDKENRVQKEAIYTINNILGESAALKKALKLSAHASKMADTSILLIGESGTGKEMFAQALHNLYRPSGPFIAINCASIPRSLIESELFGYEGGAFTGAEKKGRTGKIEMANGGTLFLDEIGDMPLEIQPILLRVLEDKRIIRLGGNRYTPVDFRVIAATNQDLNQLVSQKSFREDLYFRLAAFKINIPPLRDRDEDIMLLAQHFIDSACFRMGYRSRPTISNEARKIIMAYKWPGNIRQLKNSIEFAVGIMEDGVIKSTDLPDELTGSKSFHFGGNPLSMRESEISAIRYTLNYTNGNLRETANILGIGRATLYRKLKEYAITAE